jgi:hypothetical protein
MKRNMNASETAEIKILISHRSLWSDPGRVTP